MDAVFESEQILDRHRGARELFMGLGLPAFDRLDPSTLGGMRPRTARRDFIGLGQAMIELALTGREPSTRALVVAGGPAPDTLRRFLGCADLRNLPQILTRLAIEQGIAAIPRQIAIDARTEAIAGPEKFGVLHPQRPAGISNGTPPPNAPNSPGGIAHAFALTVDGINPSMLLADVVVMQGFWNPEDWAPKAELEAVKKQLLERAGDLDARFTTDAPSIAKALIERLMLGEKLHPGRLDVTNTVLTGGRLHIGEPLLPAQRGDGSKARLGESTEDIFIGASLEAHVAFADASIPALLEMPIPIRAPYGRRGECSWTLQNDGGREDTFAAVVSPRSLRDKHWQRIPHEVNVEIGTIADYHYMKAMAQSGGFRHPLSLLMRVTPNGECDVWSTSVNLAKKDEQRRMVHVAAEEIARRNPQSPPERALRGLLLDGWAQRNKRRRKIERDNFSALAQVVRSLIELTER